MVGGKNFTIRRNRKSRSFFENLLLSLNPITLLLLLDYVILESTKREKKYPSKESKLMATMYAVCDASVSVDGIEAILASICEDGTIFTSLADAQEFTEMYMEDCDIYNCLILEFELNTSQTKEVLKQHTVTFKTVDASTLLK